MDEYLDVPDDGPEPKIGEVIDLDDPKLKQEIPVLEPIKPIKKTRSISIDAIEEPITRTGFKVILSRDKYFITSNGVKIQRDESTKDIKKGDLFYM